MMIADVFVGTLSVFCNQNDIYEMIAAFPYYYGFNFGRQAALMDNLDIDIEFNVEF